MNTLGSHWRARNMTHLSLWISLCFVQVLQLNVRCPSHKTLESGRISDPKTSLGADSKDRVRYDNQNSIWSSFIRQESCDESTCSRLYPLIGKVRYKYHEAIRNRFGKAEVFNRDSLIKLFENERNENDRCLFPFLVSILILTRASMFKTEICRYLYFVLAML